MKKIIASIDGSSLTKQVCKLAAWVSKKTKAKITLLHIAKPHYKFEAKANNISGAIGLGAKSSLLKELTKIDENRGKAEQKRGQEILRTAKKITEKENISKIETEHKRGEVTQIICDAQKDSDLIILGKYGDSLCEIGSNIEEVARSITKPLLIASKNVKTIKRFLIAFDGSKNSQKAVQYAIKNSLLKDLECHLLKIGENDNNEPLDKAEESLIDAGFTVITNIKNQKPVEETVTKYIQKHKIDLLAIGAYGHSKIRNIIFGSTTSALINKSNVPILLFR